MNKLSIEDVYFLAIEYFNNKLTKPMLNPELGELKNVLYDSFIFKFSVDERYKNFGAGLQIDSDTVLLTLLGEKLAINNDKENIIESFKKIDSYCSLRLPDKFLEAFFNSYSEEETE